MSPIKRAIEFAGSQSRLAAAINVKPQAVQQWVAAGRVPAGRVIEIAAAVDFRVTPHEIDPELYPHPLDGLPREAA